MTGEEQGEANASSAVGAPAPGENSTPDQTPEGAVPSFSVVGIGASAGGLAAFEAFFSAMPTDTDLGMAFVLVQHLAPDHKSILTELVRRYTTMQVFEVEDGMVVRPNCTYIIPPNRDMAFLNGSLQLLKPAEPRGRRLPVDFFFRSLAQDQRERAIGIVLSGTASDGSLGVRAIKGEGGMVMAQNPESTEYDGMPRSAIATGLVDYVLPPTEMPAQLAAYVKHPAGGRASPHAVPAPTGTEDAMKKICILVRSQTGHDFSQYKKNTVTRRVERRLAVHQIETSDEYISYLRKNPNEVESLFHDLLIGVTAFFRDPEAFDALQKQAVQSLIASKPSGAPLRVWVPGCATGEEAYSIAILFQEEMNRRKQTLKLQVFATDIDPRAVQTARAGLYPASIATDVSQERLARFFVEEPDGGAYRIHKNIRDMMIFSEQSVIKDPPFSKLDLISCRNLLIYMDQELQHKLIPLFHYALNPGGVLFLGTSETVGEAPDLFATLDRKAKLYQRLDSVHDARNPAIPDFSPTAAKQEQTPRPPDKAGARRPRPLRELTERALLQQVAPAAALVSEHGDILYLHGRTGQYLEPAPGESSLNILKMAREGLRERLPAALHRAVLHRETVRRLGVRVRTNGDFTTVNLTVRPVTLGADAAHSTAPPLFLVILDEAPVAEPTTRETPPDADASVAALKQELRAKEEYLQSISEEMQSSNEELRSSNEEMQSVNEELQSTNEELETSKEELQSVNEELATVNAELQTKVADLSRAGDDMNNLLAGTGVGTVFVDHQLCIRRFTPAAAQVVNLIQTDVGRPFAHIVSNLVGYDRLVEDVKGVLDDLTPREIEVQIESGRWFLLRIRPYRTQENVIEGAVITFTDITEMRQARETLLETEALRRLAVVVCDARDAITVQNMEGDILAWNPAAVRIYGWSESEALAMNISKLVPPDRQEETAAKMKDLARAQTLEPYRTQRIARDGGTVDVWMTATALLNELGEVYAIATTERALESGTGAGKEQTDEHDIE